MSQSRQLAAIMFTDIVGYTALMGEDEQKAFELLKKNRAVQRPIIEEHNGRWLKEIGDGVLASFNAVSDAVYCASAIQKACENELDLNLRIGIHEGEVVFEGNDVFGDGVNIASRIQAIANPGCIYISEAVQKNVSNKRSIPTKYLREETLKNVKEPVKVYEVLTAAEISNTPMKRHSERPSGKSIAVLPFINMSSDPEQDYFGDGMAEEILNSLTHLKDIKVTARTSSFQFKGKNVDLREVGNLLGVNTVLEGSVRKHGNRLRITVQLINVYDGFHLWSERYDREIDDIFAIQDEIALAITEKLKVTLLKNDREQIKKTHTQNTEAYQLYHQGRYYWDRRNEEGLNLSIKYFQRAIEKDSNYALAWAGLSDSYNLLNEYGNISRSDVYLKAKEAANRALKLDARLAEAHISLACLLMLDEWDWINAGKEFKLGVDLNPNYATGHHWYSEWLSNMGKFEEALEEISQAADLDPVSLGILKDQGLTLYYSRQYDKAIDLMIVALGINQNFATFHRVLSLSYQGKEMFDQAIAENQLWGDLTGNHYSSTIALAHLYASSGRKEESNTLLESLDNYEVHNGNDYRGLALVYVALGENNTAFDLLEKSYESHEVSLSRLKTDPKLDPLRSDPRFNLLLDKVGFPK